MAMERSEELQGKREDVLERWFQAVAATYPSEAAVFLGREKDRFSNPVGYAVRTGLGQLFDGLTAARPAAELEPALDGIVRIRAVQEFAPSAALSFLFDLKPILRRECPGLPEAARVELEAAIDRLALQAFDVYMRCRETLFEIRVRELKDVQLIAARGGGCAPAQCGGSQSTAREGR
jgi:hypothetical protein